MYLIVGLGNSGEHYIKTKHNVGFTVLDEMLKTHIEKNVLHTKLTYKINKLLKAEIVELTYENKKVVLVKPITYMNESGKAVVKLVKSYDIQVARDLVVIHDDITLDLGQLKISKNVGAGNHNGVQSIINHLKTTNFIRIRLGIGRGDGILSDVVLSKFKPNEYKLVTEMIQKTNDICMTIVKKGIETAMNKYN